MIDMLAMINESKLQSYNEANAEAKVCQDVVLMLISQCSLKKNVTIKGGVVMRCLSKETRRATQDLDLDFIKYSLQDESIDEFIRVLNSVGIVSIVRYGTIVELKQQDYCGKRISVELRDGQGYVLKTKIDLGVHVKLEISQDEFCFDVGLKGQNVNLLINSKEQMFTEKLRSLLRIGSFSTRYKDIFDMYYLSYFVDTERLADCIHQIIIWDEKMRENSISDIVKRVKATFNDKTYKSKIEKSQKNWIDEDLDIVFERIVDFLQSL